MPDNLREKQPHLVTRDADGNACVVPIPLVRQVANGQHIPDNELMRVIALALLDNIDD